MKPDCKIEIREIFIIFIIILFIYLFIRSSVKNMKNVESMGNVKNTGMYKIDKIDKIDKHGEMYIPNCNFLNDEQICNNTKGCYYMNDGCRYDWANL